MCIKVVAQAVQTGERQQTNKHAHGQTDATKRIISLASRSIINAEQCAIRFPGLIQNVYHKRSMQIKPGQFYPTKSSADQCSWILDWSALNSIGLYGWCSIEIDIHWPNGINAGNLIVHWSALLGIWYWSIVFCKMLYAWCMICLRYCCESFRYKVLP